MNTRAIQTALRARGFDPGPVDGIMGRRTIAAIMAFQRANGLDVDGIVGPATAEALFGEPSDAGPLEGRPWYDLALTKKGLHEKRDNRELREFLRLDGSTLGDPAQLPWCGDFVETCLALTLPNEILPGNPYLARNWAKFGIPCEPNIGAVLVFWRGSPEGSSGHVGFYAGEDRKRFYVLGGNQSNAVTIAPIAKERLLASRWPKTAPVGRLLKASLTGGVLSVNEE